MIAPKRKKVSVVFLNEPKFEDLGLKFLVLQVNKIQPCFEFEFPDIGEYPLREENYNDTTSPIISLSDLVRDKKIEGDYFIAIVSGSIGNNWFWGSSGMFAVITTQNWEKYFSPPSVLEYIVHCITSVLILMNDESGTIKSHLPTRGCCLDYTALKEEDRVDIALGYLCDSCRASIREKIGESYLKCFDKMHAMDWLGRVEDRGTVAHNLKKYFRTDINKDTGFQKTRWEKVKGFAVDLCKTLTTSALSTVIGAFIGFILGWLLGKG